jgi:hypothetical protein
VDIFYRLDLPALPRTERDDLDLPSPAGDAATAAQA